PYSRRPARLRIHHIGGIADGSGQGLLTGIEVRESDLVRQTIAQREWRITVLRSIERFGGTEVTRFRCVIVRFAVDDAPANSQYRFRGDLIGDAEPRSESPWIVLRECAEIGRAHV